MERNISQLIATLEPCIVRGDAGTAVSGLAYDSRNVKPGFAFFALPGLHVNGHDFINKALENGASAIIHSEELPEYRADICYVKVADPRFAMSPVASAFWGNPSGKIVLIGVTGTEGKSTTVWLISQLLTLAGFKTGFISTVEYKVAGTVECNPDHQTTPEATTIHEKLAKMVENGLEYAVLESSSHGLSPRTNRLGNVQFDVGVMTNVRHEHLEFHGTWECYRDDKARLLSALDASMEEKSIGGKTLKVPAFGVVCADDPSAAFFADITEKPVYTYSVRTAGATISATEIDETKTGSTFLLRFEDCYQGASIKLPGAFNVENTLAAIVVVHKLTGTPVDELVDLLPGLTPVRGRMSRIEAGQDFEVLVDYAHTPSSFEAILPAIKARAKNSVICVFGSGGERDTQKRPAQGAIASKYCDIVILADEDPRGEDPLSLLEDIAAGCKEKIRGENLFLIPDRAQAIRKAFALAKPGSIVLLLGKGHENTILKSSGTIPWDEIAEATNALAKMGFTKKKENA